MLGIRVFLTLVLVALLIFHFFRRLWSRKRYPPGPFPLPAIGGLWRIAIRLYQDTILIKQKGSTEKFVTPFINAVTNERDLVFSNAHIWREQRDVGRIAMRKMDQTKKGLEYHVKEASHQLVDMFASMKDQPFDPLSLITNSVCNVICSVAFGYGFSTEDKNFQKLTEAIGTSLKFGGSFIYALQKKFPWIMKLVPGPHKKALSSKKLVISFIKMEIKKHKKQDFQHKAQDFIDCYLIQIEKGKSYPGSTYSEENLAQCIFDLFIAGTETTATTLQWALLLMATHPEIQAKVHKEMEDVFGSSHIISYKDGKKLPFTNAVIHEIQRAKYASLFRVIRQFSSDVNIFRFLFPKGIIIPDLNSVLLDPKLWETPEKFNPSHFLDKKGNFVSKDEFLLFGEDEGSCLEDQLARTELFIFFTHLVRAFNFQLPKGVNKIDREPRVGLTTQPHSYKVIAVPRSKQGIKL